MELMKEMERLEQQIIKNFEEKKDKIYPCLKPIETETRFEVEHEGKQLTIDLPNIPFLGKTSVFFVQDEDEVFQLIQKRMLPQGTSVEELLQLAMKNLIRDYPFELFEADYGGYALRSDPDHTSSYLLLQSLWQSIATKDLKDDLILSAPARDIILFVKASDQVGIQNLKETAKKVYANNFKELTLGLFYFEKDTGIMRDVPE